MKKIIYFLVIMLCITGCNTKEEIHNPAEDIQTPETAGQVIQEIIYNQYSKYAKYFDANVDIEVSYGSSSSHPMQTRGFSAQEITLSRDGALSTRSGAESRIITINGKTPEQLNQLTAIQTRGGGDPTLTHDLYGQEVTFTIKESILVNDVPVLIDTAITMYVPKMAEIAYPKAHQVLYPVCKFNNYRLQWDKDLLNDNGMVIIVEWDGDMLEGSVLNTYIQRIDIVEDNGETIIKPEMFEDIPHTAIARVSILRGNIEIAEITEDMVYKFYAESNASLRTIILKEDIVFE